MWLPQKPARITKRQNNQEEQVMSNMETDIPGKESASFHPTLSILKYLSTCESRSVKSKQTAPDIRATKISNYSLLWAGVALAALALLAGWHQYITPLHTALINLALTLSALSAALVLVAFSAPIAASAINLFWWKKINFKNLSDDIQHESNLAAELTRYDEQTLLNAKYWLDLQMKRAEARVSYFFGEKTAALALLGMAYICTKELGGLHWLGESLKTGLSLGNIGNTALLAIIAFIFGISIGALFLKHIAYRYRFQIELIDIALRCAILQPAAAAAEQEVLAAKIHTHFN
jgi:hypothetical protein